MRTFDELAAWAKSAQGGGFDVSPARAGEAVTSAIRRLATRSRWLSDERELGPTVVDQEIYAIPADVLDVREISVDGDPMYLRVSLGDLRLIRTGRKTLPRKFTGAFAPSFSGGARSFRIWPAPDTAGLEINGLVEVQAPAISGATVPPFPDDGEDALRAYIKADLYDDIDEDPNSAQVQQAKGDAYAVELFKRGKSQVGSGPVQMQVARAHF